MPAPPAAVDAYVAILGAGARAPALGLARELRERGVAADADLMARNLSKALQHASKLGARLVVIVGEKDLASGTVTVRDMTSGEQATVPLGEAVANVASRLGLL